MVLFDEKLEQSIKNQKEFSTSQKEFSAMQSQMNKYFLGLIKNNPRKP